MNKEIKTILVSVSMGLSLITLACTPAAVQNTQPASSAPSITSSPSNIPVTQTSPATEENSQQEAVAAPTAEKPQYGGTLYMALGSDITKWSSNIDSC